jgi:hypothetical protein
MIDWYAKLWQIETPDLPAEVEAVERTLGLALPPLLREL